MFVRLYWLCSVAKCIKTPSAFYLDYSYPLYTLIVEFCTVFKTPVHPHPLQLCLFLLLTSSINFRADFVLQM